MLSKIIYLKTQQTIIQIKNLKEDIAFWLDYERHRRKFDKRIEKVCKMQFQKEKRDISLKIMELHQNNQDIDSSVLFDKAIHDEWTYIVKKVYEIVGKYFFDKQIDDLKKQVKKLKIKQDSIQIFDELNRLRRDVLTTEVQNPNYNDIYVNIVNLPTTQVQINNNSWYVGLIAYLTLHIDSKINYITNTTKTLVQNEVQAWKNNKEDITQLLRRIEILYDRLIAQRASIIAQTEVASASNFGSRTATDTLSVPLKHTWISTMDTRVRDIHKLAHGQTKPKEEPFIVGGERLKYPHDVSLGATAKNIVNCRCIERIEIDKERLGGIQ